MAVKFIDSIERVELEFNQRNRAMYAIAYCKADGIDFKVIGPEYLADQPPNHWDKVSRWVLGMLAIRLDSFGVKDKAALGRLPVLSEKELREKPR